MPNIKVDIDWAFDDRHIRIEGTMSQKAFDYLKDQLKEDDRDLITVAGITPSVVQVGSDQIDPEEERVAGGAIVTAKRSDVVEFVADIEDEDDDDDTDYEE